MSAPRAGQTEFYVGYLALPRYYRVAMRVSVALLLCVAAVAASLSAASQRDPGDGIWDSGRLRSWEGVIDDQPYPLIRVADNQGRVRTLPIVEMGKFGGGQRAAPYVGQLVSVQGYLLSRDGREMVELNPDAPDTPTFTVIRADPDKTPVRLRRPLAQRLGQSALRGEIVDTKCYLGAMKPGSGKTHKECATLCIAGGIPPTFVTFDPAGHRSYYLLADMDGRAVNQAVLPFVADYVEISGEIEQLGDIRVLRMRPEAIRRLSPASN